MLFKAAQACRMGCSARHLLKKPKCTNTPHLSHARSSTYRLALAALPSSPIATASWLPRVLLLLPMLPQLLRPLPVSPAPPPLLRLWCSCEPYSSASVRYL